MSLFSFKEIGVKSESKEAENYSAFTSKLLNIQTAKIEKLSTDLLRLPQDGECIFLQTMQAFNAFDSGCTKNNGFQRCSSSTRMMP